jgi:hypothetical protein
MVSVVGQGYLGGPIVVESDPLIKKCDPFSADRR